MRDNRNDSAIERNYAQNWRFLISEYLLVKSGDHPKFRFAQDFYKPNGVNRQTFAKRFNRFREFRRPRRPPPGQARPTLAVPPRTGGGRTGRRSGSGGR